MFVGTLWKELVWVFSPEKYGGTRIRYVDYWNLLCPLPMALGMLSLRYVLTRYCYIPFGKYLGVKNNKPQLEAPNPVLEITYAKWKHLSHPQIADLAKQLDMSERQVERWLRQRKRQDRPSFLTKFSECCWRCTYYICMFSYGLVVLWNKPWFTNISECWSGFPTDQPITNDIWWYYMLAMAFSWSLFFGQFCIDVKRKDFLETFIHHVATILLLCFSWLAGLYRVGTLVMIVHDFADIFLELAKITKYAEYQATCTTIFSFFAVAWIVTRLGIFPLWIIKHTLFEAPKFLPNFPAYYTFNGLLVVLLMLHCFWTYLILKIALKMFEAGQMEGDVRSSSEDEPVTN